MSRAAGSESEERVAEEAADVLYHLQVLLASRGISIASVLEIAEWPSPLSVATDAGPMAVALSRARPRAEPRAGARAGPRGQRDPGSHLVRRRLRDPGLRLPEAPHTTAPASCSSPPSRDAWAATRSSASAHARCCAGSDGVLSEWPGDAAPAPSRAAPPTPRTPTRRSASTSAVTGSRRSTTCRRSPAAPSGSSATTWFARSSRSASRTPTRSGFPDMALMVSDVLVVFDHMRHELTLMAYAFLDDETDVDAAYARAARRSLAAARAPPRTRRRAAPSGDAPDARRATPCRSSART